MAQPQRVGGVFGASLKYAVGYTPTTPGSTLIITVFRYGGNTDLTAVVDSLGQTVTTDFPLTEIAGTVGGVPYDLYLGVYRISSVLPGFHTITLDTTGGGWTGDYIAIDEVVNILGPDTGAGTVAGTYGDSTTLTTGSVTPTAADDYLHAALISNAASVVFSAYTNSFAQGQAVDAGISCATAYLVDSASGTAIDAGATLSASNNWAALLVPYLFGITPFIGGVNSGNVIDEGSTGVPITGSNFAAGMTGVIVQGSNSLAQAVTYVSATSATFDLAMEPALGAQLAFTDATYSTKLYVTAGGEQSEGWPISLAPPTGNLFQTLANVHPTSSWRIQTIPDLEVGDQIEASGNATGTTAAPAGLALNPDGTFEFTNGAWANFYVRVYKASDSAWTPWAEIVCTGLAQADGFD